MIDAVSSISSSIGRAGGITAIDSTSLRGLAGAAATGTPQTSFSDMMAHVASNAVDTLKAGEAASIQGLQGKASVQQVVEAVMSAEQTLQTAIAIRDKVVAAYQEISRMAI
jgi:flagellar hook-basal body complex protein FliE